MYNKVLNYEVYSFNQYCNEIVRFPQPCEFSNNLGVILLWVSVMPVLWEERGIQYGGKGKHGIVKVTKRFESGIFAGENAFVCCFVLKRS